MGDVKRRFAKRAKDPAGPPPFDAVGDPEGRVKVTDPLGRNHFFLRRKTDPRADPQSVDKAFSRRLAVWARRGVADVDVKIPHRSRSGAGQIWYILRPAPVPLQRTFPWKAGAKRPREEDAADLPEDDAYPEEEELEVEEPPHAPIQAPLTSVRALEAKLNAKIDGLAAKVDAALARLDGVEAVVGNGEKVDGRRPKSGSTVGGQGLY